MLIQIAADLLDLTASVKGAGRSRYAYIPDLCSCCCRCPWPPCDG